MEIYRTPVDQTAHRQTDHFKRWFNAVTEGEMFAAPRTLALYTLIE